MKKIYTLLTLAVISLVAFTAKGATITLNIDDASHVSVQVAYVDTPVVTGVNTIDVGEGSNVYISAAEGCAIKSVVRGSDGVSESIYNMIQCNLWCGSSQDGESWTVTTATLDEMRTAKAYVTVDDPTKVSLQLQGTYSRIDTSDPATFPANTPVEVKFIPDMEGVMTVSAATYGDNLFKVELNGTVVEPSYGTWYVNLTEGAQVVVTANFPDEDYPVNFVYNSEDAKNAITNVTVDGEAVSGYNDAGFTVHAGKTLAFDLNRSNYDISSFKVNGEEKIDTWKTSHSQMITGETTFEVRAVPFDNITATIVIDHPEAVTFYHGYSYLEDVITLSEGSNVLTYSSNDALVTFKANDGYMISSISDGTTEYKDARQVTLTDGMVLTVTSGTLESLRNASVFFTIDEPSKVKIQRYGTYSYVDTSDPATFPANTRVEVKYIKGTEDNFLIGVQNYGESIYQVKRNGEVIEPSYGSYQVTVAENDEFEVTVNYPDVDCPVHFQYSEDAVKPAIYNVTVDGVAVENYNDADFSVKAGQTLAFSINRNDYNLESMTVNGTEKLSSWTSSFSQIISEETTIVLTGHPFGTVTATINVDNADAVTFYKGYSWREDVIALTTGANTVTLSENDAMLTFEAKDGFYIVSVSDGTNEYKDMGQVTITDGMTLTVTTGEVVRENKMILYVNDITKANWQFAIDRQDHTSYSEAVSGYNVVPFASNEVPFGLGAYGNFSTMIVYLDGEVLQPESTGGTYYMLPAANNSVVKVFFDETPATYNVKFTTDFADSSDFIVISDLVKVETDWANADGLSALSGTQFGLVLPDNIEENATVTVDGNAISADEETGSYIIIADANKSVKITDNSGVSMIGVDAKASRNVYNTLGVLVIENATDAQIKALPAGVYVMGGKKIIARGK